MSKGGERGYRYWEAMKLISGAPFPGGLSPWNDGSEDGALRHRLVNGDWHATGRRVRGQGKDPAKREVIPTDLWEVLRIDPDNDTAAGGGLEFVGTRFHPGAPPQPPAKSTVKGRADCLDWLIEEFKTPKKRYKTDYEADALNGRFPGLKERQFRELWRDAMNAPTTDSSWKKRGSLPGG